jgi:hypothetical protein
LLTLIIAAHVLAPTRVGPTSTDAIVLRATSTVAACISSMSLADEVHALSDQTLATSLRDPTSIRVTVGITSLPGSGEGSYAELEARDRDGLALGRRHLHLTSASCDENRRALALVIALLFEEGHAEIARTPLVPRAPEPIGTTGARARDGAPWALGFGAYGAIAAELLPWPALGVGAAARLAPPGEDWSFELDVVRWFAREVDAGSGSVSIAAVELGLVLCRRAFAARVADLAACVGVDVSRIEAEPKGLVEPVPGVTWASGARGMLTLGVRISDRVSIPLAVALVGLWARPDITYEPGRVAFEPALIGFAARAGISVTIP